MSITLRGRMRALNRLRWWTKYRLVADGHRFATHREAVFYVMWDPELHTFSYDVIPSAEDAVALAGLVGSATPHENMARDCWNELSTLRADLPRLTRSHPESKKRPAFGRHLTSFLAVRIFRPTLIIEVGVHFGLGTLALDEARRGFDADCQLVSIDFNPSNGWLPRSKQIDRWTFFCDDAASALQSVPTSHGPVMAILDATSDDISTSKQVAEVLRIAAEHDCLILMNSSWSQSLRQVAKMHHAPMITIKDREPGVGHRRSLDCVLFRGRESL